jgi:hypothetical protein
MATNKNKRKLRAPKVADSELSRVIADIYDELNKLSGGPSEAATQNIRITSVSQSQLPANPIFDDVTVDTLLFNTTYTVTDNEAQGTFYWNSNEETVSLVTNGSVLDLGHALEVHVKVTDTDGVVKGDVVGATGAVGSSGKIEVQKFTAGTSPTRTIVGIMAEDVAVGEFGKAVAFGKIRKIDTDTPAWDEGTILYAGSDGALTSTEPGEGNVKLPIAFVVTRHQNTGELFVRITPIDENIDADKLDGEHGTYYLDYANFTGTPGHPEITTSALEQDNSGNTFIQDLNFDSNGHVTSVTSASASFADTNYYPTTLGSSFTSSSGLLVIGDETSGVGGMANVEIDLSTIDADKLDGQEGSYYLNYNNLNNKPALNFDNYQYWSLTVNTTTQNISSQDVLTLSAGDNVSLEIDGANVTINSSLPTGAIDTITTDTGSGLSSSESSGEVTLNLALGNLAEATTADSLDPIAILDGSTTKKITLGNLPLSAMDNTTSGFISDYTVTQADVTQHQAALTISESQISPALNYDNYDYWTLTVDTDSSDISSSDVVTFIAGTNVTLDKSGSNITINSSVPGGYIDTISTSATSGLTSSEDAGTVTLDLSIGNLTAMTATPDNQEVIAILEGSTTKKIALGSIPLTAFDNTSSGFISSYTETNDLTSAVTWANVPDANITQSSVTQHQSALSIDKSQITNFGTYDNYVSWTITDGTNSAAVVKDKEIRFTGAGAASVSYNDSTGFVTITSTDTNTDTNYYAINTGTGYNASTKNLTIAMQGTTDVTADLSAIDADKLDGQEGTYYLDYNNFNNTPSLSFDNYESWRLTDGSSTYLIKGKNGSSTASLLFSGTNDASVSVGLVPNTTDQYQVTIDVQTPAGSNYYLNSITGNGNSSALQFDFAGDPNNIASFTHDFSHNHDDLYYTESEVNTLLSSYLTTTTAAATYVSKSAPAVGADLDMNSNTITEVESIILVNKEGENFNTATGRLMFDENFYSDTEYGSADVWTTNGGGLVIRNEDGWGRILSDKNMEYLNASFASISSSGSIEVQGITAQSNANPRIQLIETDTTDENKEIMLSGGDFFIRNLDDDGTNPSGENILKISHEGVVTLLAQGSTTSTSLNALFQDGNGVLKRRTLGSNAFNSTAFITSSSFTVADDDTNTTNIATNDSLTISGGTGIDVAVTTGTVTITSTYSETDTLASVTARGASTSTSTTFSGGLVASGGISGLTLNNGISGSNFNISGVNQISINDPGEGIVFGGGSSGNITLALVDDANDNILRLSGTGATLQVGTNRVLTTADEGNGNGLDADTLDGQHASAFLTSFDITTQTDPKYLRSNADDTATGKITINDGDADPLRLQRSSQVGIFFNDTSAPRYLGVNSGNLHFGTNLNHGINNKVFHDGYHPNADTLTTAREITLGGDLTGSAFFDGSADITISAQVSNNSHTHDDRYLQLSGGTLTGSVSSNSEIFTSDHFTSDTGELLSLYQSSWANQANHYVLFNNWRSATGDYLLAKASGNSAGSVNGTLLIADNGLYYGSHGAQSAANDSATAPLDTTLLYFRSGGSYLNSDLDVNGTTTSDKFVSLINSDLSSIGVRDWLKVGTYSRGAGVEIGDIDGARYAFWAGGYDLTFGKHISTTDTYTTVMQFLATGVTDSSVDVVFPNNNVGIGTTSPQELLHVDNGNIRLDSNSNGNSGLLRFYDASNTESGQIYPHSGDLRIYSPNDVLFNNAGNVGIGTNSPSEKLHLSSGRSDILTESTTAGSATRYRLKTTSREWRIGTHAGLNDSLWFYDVGASAYRMVIDTNGSVGINDTTPDASFKLDVNGAGRFVNDLYANEDLVVNDTLYVGNTTTGSHKMYVEGGAGHDIVAKFKTTGAGTSDYSEIHIENNAGNRTVLGSIGSNYTNADWANSSYLYNTGTGRKFLIKSQNDMVFTTGGTSLSTNKRMTIASGGEIQMHNTLKLESLAQDTASTSALVWAYDGTQTVKYRTLGSNAFNSTAFLTTETDPTVPSHVKSITTGDIANWNTAYNNGLAGVSFDTSTGVLSVSGQTGAYTTDLDGRYLQLSGGTITDTLTIDSSESANHLVIKAVNPTINLLDDDSGADDFYIHVNSNNFYILTNRDGNNVVGGTNSWESPHPLQLEADTNIAYTFGQRIFNEAYHPNADKLTTAREIELTGDVTGSVFFDGSGDVSITTAVVNNSHTHDDRYYTETEIGNFFSGTTGITGYNKSNWDSSYQNSLSGVSFNTTTGVLTVSAIGGGYTADLDGRYLTSFDITTQTDPKYLRSNSPDSWNIGRGDVYVENNSNSNANGAGITFRTSSNPSSDGASIFDVRSSGQAVRLFVGQNLTSSGYNPFYAASSNANDAGSLTSYNHKLGLSSEDTYLAKNGGNVGIGTTSPSSKLEVAGSGLFSAAGSTFVKAQRTGTSPSTAVLAADTGVTRLYARDASTGAVDMLFQTGTTDKMVIKAGGNIGIGNTAPAQKLVVNGGIHAYGNIATPASGTYGLLMDYYIADSRFWSRGTTSGGTRGAFKFYQLEADGTNQITSFELDTSGNASFNYDLQVDGDLSVGDGSTNSRVILKKSDNNVSDHIQFYNGTTRVGEIGCEDTTWLRINQETAKNIYTPRYIRADGGFFVDGSSKGINGSGNFVGGTITGASDANVTDWNNAYQNSVTGVDFNTGTGVLSVNTIGGSYTKDLDGRYLTSFDITTQTDPKYLRSNASDTGTGQITLQRADDTPLVLNNTTNGGFVGIEFSDNSGGSYAQKAYFRYTHLDSQSQGGGASFHFTGTESGLRLIMPSDGVIKVGTNTVFHDGYHPNADKLTTAREINLGGDASGSVFFDGSGDVTLTVAVANDSHTHDGRYFTETESDARYLRSNASDTTTGNITIGKADPILVLNDTSTSSTTTLTAYTSFQAQGSQKGYVGYGSGGNNWLYVRNNDGRVDINGSQGVYVQNGLYFGTGTDALDEYEEGTFTPIYRHTSGNPSSVTYDSQTYGKYTRIGNVVHCSGRIRTDAITWASTSYNTTLGGFPFTCSTPLSTGTGAIAGVIGFASGFASTKPVTFQMRDGETNALLYGESITSSEVRGQPNIKSGDFTTGTSADKNTIVFQITYHVA